MITLLLCEYEVERDARTSSRTSTVQRFKVLCPGKQRFFIVEFRTVNTNFKDQLCFVRPREVDREAAIETTEENTEAHRSGLGVAGSFAVQP
ncbi:hypothetical protein KIN20_001975 [Parelaphostrongylus tenuis]|uniref:Uncharacterized protein n=1 Tax=Parelaphostrongylus tenuis TaxID=148309 RepID=A0AAD5QGH9_PARTN|nr:hypothetical protein KIN20_001974 [Parelaphostrongylus tenuis]KAJ1347035.1 hypothetical protein KIN20_001975 [Parelaphostrongylus tenuis]